MLRASAHTFVGKEQSVNQQLVYDRSYKDKGAGI